MEAVSLKKKKMKVKVKGKEKTKVKGKKKKEEQVRDVEDHPKVVVDEKEEKGVGIAIDRKEAEPANEIDNIFRQKPQRKESDPSEKQNQNQKKKKKKKNQQQEEMDDFLNNGVSKRRKVDGFTVYTAEELGFGKGGGTPDCPFDCNCCF